MKKIGILQHIGSTKKEDGLYPNNYLGSLKILSLDLSNTY